jgi:hypothetical protein
MVRHRGIEANPIKVDAIRNMAKPSCKKDVMKLTGMMAALGCFISKLGEKGLPFFKLLKKADKFVWDEETQKACEALKDSLTTPNHDATHIRRNTPPLHLRHHMWSALFSSQNEKKKGRPIRFNDLCTT